MKSTQKRITLGGLSAVCALSLAAGLGVLSGNNAYNNAYAETADVPSSVYYYDNLTDAAGKEYTLAKKFYEVLDLMNKNGDFKDGVVDYSLTDIVTSAQIEAWVENGDLTIPKAFSAARDSYCYDHPELFYIDIYKLTISAVRSSGVYSAFIDCGREKNCYIDGGFESLNEVETAIEVFDEKVDEVVTYAREKAQAVAGLTDEKVSLAAFANEFIAEHVDYDYEAYYGYLEAEGDVYAGAFTYNAYGALVLGQSVCSGYSRAYKAVLDKLEIPCVVISGNSLSKAGDGKESQVGEAHSWNYVWFVNPSEDGVAAQSETVEGGWYAYDVTWNSTSTYSNSYVQMNALANGRIHVEDPVVSSSNYEMPYPELAQNSYGNTTVNNEFMHSFTYEYDETAGTEGNGVDDYGNPFMTKEERVSYKGKSAKELLADKLYIIYRFYYDNGHGQMLWSNWTSLGHASDIYDIDKGHETALPSAANGLYSQFAVVDVDADLDYFGNPVGAGDRPLSYSSDFKAPDGKDLGEHTLYISEIYVNKTFGTYTPAPYIVSTTPKHTETLRISDDMAVSAQDTTMADKYTFTLNVTYDEVLTVLEEGQPIVVKYITEFNNIYDHSELVPFETGEYVRLSEDGKTLTFRFKPSLMYEHNSALYSFYFENVGSTKTLNGRMSKKAPNPVHYHFARYYTVCNQILGGGRLWIDCCAQPTLVSNTDLAGMDFTFTDENGESTFSENARSQMMLVVESVSKDTENEMLNGINDNFGISGNDIKSSETYDINLQICNKYPTISDGSYVKIALGFPQGYGPEDEGVTFKLYHRKHVQGDKYIIEEVPCVVTQFGIVATVTSFSPYMVAAVSGDKVSADKYVYASIEGKGGTLSREDGKIQTVKTGGSYTYTIKPDAGYKIYNVSLNGKDVTANVGADGKLTLTYDNLLNNNELVIQYISDAAAQRYEEKQVELVEPVLMVVSTDGKVSAALTGDQLPVNKLVPVDNSSHTALIIVLSVIGGVVVAGAVVAAVVLLKRKKANAGEEAGE